LSFAKIPERKRFFAGDANHCHMHAPFAHVLPCPEAAIDLRSLSCEVANMRALNRSWQLLVLVVGTLTSMPVTAAEPVEAQGATAVVLTAGEAGTGCVIDAEGGLVLTCHHVVSNSESASVLFPARDAAGKLLQQGDQALRRSQHAIAAIVIARDVQRDLALLELQTLPAGMCGIKLASASARPGEQTLRLGSPAAVGRGWQTTAATVSHAGMQTFHYPARGQHIRCRVLETDAPQFVGESGGPVLNNKGELIGINAAGRERDRLSIAIDVAEVRTFLQRHRPINVAYGDKTTTPAQ
jgi:S1-C subfamily serine protease